MRLEGAEGGSKRPTRHVGDAYQGREEYIVKRIVAQQTRNRIIYYHIEWLQNVMKHASRGAFISGLEKSCRGIVAHFQRSRKVKHHMLWQHCIEPYVIINFMSTLAGYEQVARVKCSYNTSQLRIRDTMERYDRHLHLDWQALGYIGGAIRGA